MEETKSQEKLKDLNFEENSFYILKQLEVILRSDPLIDEVGFLHPSQFAALNEETYGSANNVRYPENEMSSSNAILWNRDHKLAISTEVLFPLYAAAKHAFKAADEQYKMLTNLPTKRGKSVDETATNSSPFSTDFLESEVMMHSKALLLLSCDSATAWNSRKLVISKKQQLSLSMDELLFSSLILSYAPKSENAWSHRRWVVKTIARTHPNVEKIVYKESELVEKLAEKSKMNYRVWYHRCWLISYLTRTQVVEELNKSKKWAELHVADNCCFHYRLQLLLKMIEQGISKHGQNVFIDTYPELYRVWKEELDWNKMLIKRYVGREALWGHRRFLSQCWVKHFGIAAQDGANLYKDDFDTKDAISTFMADEIQLLQSCLTIRDDDFEDWHTQAVLAAAYILWLSKQIPHFEGVESLLKIKEEVGDLKALLHKLCPEKASLWNGLIY
ncbi:hypothetical protein MKW94_010423 [Papaver nudicaule]|uniref:Uncharacterized protein n=1 Tax=Papaver nudicaule TaxID=74823 RepID=A0AA41V1W5_PAPNU|nr:hypothetical protein [Papaver nudicaule]